jgi:chromosome segregation ATPase
MVDILKVMMDSEEERHKASNAIIEQRESQIADLITHSSALQQRVHDLQQKNNEMTGKLAGFKDRCAAYKAHMNQVTEGHKALWERGEELKRARDDLLATLEERDFQNLEAQKKIDEVRVLFSAEVKKTWRDARQKLADRKSTAYLALCLANLKQRIR